MASAPKAVDHSPQGRVTISSKQAYDESTLTPDALVATVMTAYMADIKSCYKHYLATDASARGKVMLTITVDESLRSVSPKASGFAGPIDECLTSMMTSWMFQKPLDRDGEPTAAAFGIALQLVPD